MSVKDRAVRKLGPPPGYTLCNQDTDCSNVNNNLPTFDTAFTVQNVSLGGTITFDFKVSDLDL
jgi:hypothetical protein